MTLIVPPSQAARYARELSPAAAMVNRKRVLAQVASKLGNPVTATVVFTVFEEVLITVTCGQMFAGDAVSS